MSASYISKWRLVEQLACCTVNPLPTITLRLAFSHRILPMAAKFCHQNGAIATFFRWLVVASILAYHPVSCSNNAIPIIGILSQPLVNSSASYIAASYVKWLEVGGATSIAIPFDASTDAVKEICRRSMACFFLAEVHPCHRQPRTFGDF